VSHNKLVMLKNSIFPSKDLNIKLAFCEGLRVFSKRRDCGKRFFKFLQLL